MNNLTIEDAKFMFRPNFSGEATQYNPAGNRNFSVRLDEDMAQKAILEGWNVRKYIPKNGGDPVDYINVKVKMDGYKPPKAFMVTSNGKTLLNEDTIGELDHADIAAMDLTLTPYEWEVNGKRGVKAYLKTLYAVLEEDEFEEKYKRKGNFEEDEECPF